MAKKLVDGVLIDFSPEEEAEREAYVLRKNQIRAEKLDKEAKKDNLKTVIADFEALDLAVQAENVGYFVLFKHYLDKGDIDQAQECAKTLKKLGN